MLITPNEQAQVTAVMLRSFSSLNTSPDSDAAGIFTKGLSSLPGVGKAFVCLGDPSHYPWASAGDARPQVCTSCRTSLPRSFQDGRFDCPLMSMPQLKSFPIVSQGRAFGCIAVDADEGASAWLQPIFENTAVLLGQVLENRLHAQNIIDERRTLESAFKESTEKLLHNERFLEQIFQSLQDGLCVLDKSLTILRVNHFMEASYASEMPLVGRKCYEVYHGRSEACEACPSLETLRTGRACVQEVPYIDEGKQRGWMELSTFPMRDENGSVVGVIESVKNVTGRKLAEEALRASEEKYRGIFDSALVATFRTSVDDGLVLDANDQFARLYGCAGRDDVIGKIRVSSVYVDPDARNHLIAQLRSQAGPLSYESALRRMDGSVFCVRGSLRLNAEKGYIEGVAIDITAQKDAEETLRLTQFAIDHAVDAAYWLDNSGRFVYVNDAACRLYGYTRDELFAMRAPDTDADPTKTDWSKDWEEGKHIGHRTSLVMKRRKDGTVFPTEITTNYVPFGDKEYRCVFVRDITQRLKLEEALRLTQYAVDHGVDAAYWLDKAGRFVYVNDAACKMYGYTREELLAMNVTQTDFAPNLPGWNDDWEQVNTGGSQTYQWTKRRKDGTPFPVELTINQLRFGNNEYRCVFVRDITQRLKLEETLRLTQFAVDHGVDAAYWLDDTSRFVYVNDAACKMYGYSREELLKMSVLDTDVVPEPELWEKRWDEFGRSTSHTYRWNKHRKDGTTFPVELTLNQLKFGDKEYRCVFAKDITDRVKLEQALNLTQYAVDHSSEAAFLVNRDGRFVYVNDAACAMFDYTRDELLTMHLFDTFGGPLGDSWESHWETVHRHGTLRSEGRHRRRDGTVFPTEIIINHVEFDGQEYHFDFASDISSRLALEEQLRQAQKMEAIGRLAGGVAHDFNNTLQGILGSAEMALAETAKDDPRYTDLAEIRMGADRAAELTGQLLAFSRRQLLQPQDVNLNAVIDETLRLLRRILPENIRVDLVRENDLSTVYADPTQMQQVVVNLCLNARDAMPDGGALTIETANVTLDDDYCQVNLWARPGSFALLTVTDSGCGMNEETLSHIFEPFFTTKEVGKGTGLGLATVYGIVRQHGGMVTAYSEVGCGTTVKVYMPKVARTAAPIVQPLSSPVRGGTETVLVAEDEPIVRNLDKRILERHGYTVILANDGEEAVRLFEENKDRIDVAFLDLVMPKLGGIEASLKMRQVKPSLKLLFASGYSVTALHSTFRGHDGLTILGKPYNPDDLLRKLREVLDQ